MVDAPQHHYDNKCHTVIVKYNYRKAIHHTHGGKPIWVPVHKGVDLVTFNRAIHHKKRKRLEK